ncbi:iron-containing alcohol dehydrogenase [Kineococcus sp. T90]|nr:iron-containing alcohol dehydrogenase [Kineococcus indalonis]
MGAVVLTGARLGRGSLVAAGAVVREGSLVPPGSLVAGVPAQVRRLLLRQRHALGEVVARTGTSALVVTDPHLAAGPALGELVALLRSRGLGVSVFDEAAPELPVEQVPRAVEAARRGGADVVVGLGGGSCLDLAKVVALALAHPGPVQGFYGENLVPGPTAPVVAVPTTAGTGSEVTPVAVVTDPERATKVGISSPHLVPAAAVCDAELTLTCPPAVTAAAGADALSHAVEAFTAVRRPLTPGLSHERVFVGKGAITDVFALLAVRSVAAHLRRACEVPDDLTARSGMVLAALAGGLAFGTAGTAAAHALQYPVGALTRTSHGLGVGALLPYVMAFNAAARGPELAELAGALGVGGAPDPARAAVRAVAELLASVGIPRDLAALGLDAALLPRVAAGALSARRLVENNPRPLDEASALALLRAAHAGDLEAAAAAGAPAGSTTGTTTTTSAVPARRSNGAGPTGAAPETEMGRA